MKLTILFERVINIECVEIINDLLLLERHKCYPIGVPFFRESQRGIVGSEDPLEHTGIFRNRADANFEALALHKPTPT